LCCEISCELNLQFPFDHTLKTLLHCLMGSAGNKKKWNTNKTFIVNMNVRFYAIELNLTPKSEHCSLFFFLIWFCQYAHWHDCTSSPWLYCNKNHVKLIKKNIKLKCAKRIIFILKHANSHNNTKTENNEMSLYWIISHHFCMFSLIWQPNLCCIIRGTHRNHFVIYHRGHPHCVLPCNQNSSKKNLP
jgi:hypothetical protein